MLINNKMTDALNVQINKELYSSYLYLSMSSYFEASNLSGFANWVRKQADEEREHAMKIFDYVIERGGRVILKSIDSPKTEWRSPLDVFLDVYEHEKKVTEMINNLYELAKQEKDYATENFLQWFIAEQVEEEAHASEIVEKLKLIGDNIGAIFMLDSKLGTR